jgi:ADP-ribose pyrophosphatase
MVYVQVDMTLSENQHPKPDLEDNEFIECFTIPVSRLSVELQKLENEGYAIDARVGSIAQGIEIAKKLRL